ncbi:tetratricopeptide repeat protein [Streptomyces sp. NPDC059063]|uniref:tetratricopeptide repeat protein n=1 Tax=Streptomyces sp. NPDC059063 TaxID=3346712 RepID=UPI0036BCED15
MTIDRLRDTLNALGPPVTPLELAEMLWLAERLPRGPGEEDPPRGTSPAASFPGVGTQRAGMSVPLGTAVEGNQAGALTPRTAGPKEAPEPAPAPAARPLHIPRGTGLPGTDAAELLVPAPRTLRDELAVQRALRPLKRRVPDPRRRTLDEDATATRAASRRGPHPWAPVMVPVTDRWLSLALVVDTGPAMAVWRPLVRELRDAMQRTGAFRDVRVWHLTDTGSSDTGSTDADPAGAGVPNRHPQPRSSRLGIRSSPHSPLLPPDALTDPTGRQVTLVLGDCSGPHWWAGLAGPVLHAWAKRGPTAVLQPLPERLWRRTAAPAVPGAAIASRAGAPNTALRFTPHDGRAPRPADAAPVPVLELAPDWLADWVGLVTASGDHHRDTAVTYVSPRVLAHPEPLTIEGDLPVADRVLRFQSAASPTAADLAAHVALSVPALPVMRLIQRCVTPHSRPSDLAEVLLSGLLEPVDAQRDLYDFVPGARGALLETLPRPESLAVAETLTRIGDEIQRHEGAAAHAFRAVVPVEAGTGTRKLGDAGRPFALVSEEALGVLRGVAIEVSETPRPTVRISDGGQLVAGDHDLVVGDRDIVVTAASEVRAHTVGPSAPTALTPPDLVPPPAALRSFPRARLFVGRERRLHELELALDADELGSPLVVLGMPGVGKSALVGAWAASHYAAYAPLWWLKADSPESPELGLADLAVALHPPLRGDEFRDLRREWILQWLAAHQDWLLILDDVRDPAHVGELLARTGAGGRFLITSRRRTGWHTLARTQTLDVLERPEAVDLFQRIVGESTAADDTDRLCGELGCLPLAVEQAAAYCAQAYVSPGDYATMLENDPAVLYTSEVGGASVARVLSDALADLDDPLAVRILLVLAWYAPDGIPRTLPLSLGGYSEVTASLGRLASRSLITLDADTVSVHPVLQAVARVAGEFPEGGAARFTAYSCLVEALPGDPADDPDTWPGLRALLPHIDAYLARSGPQGDDSDVLLLERAGEFVLTQGQFRQAVGRLDQALAVRRRVSGPRDPKSFRAAARLADAYGEMGDVEAARRLYEETLAGVDPDPGADHDEALPLFLGLVAVLLEQGRWDEAIALCERTLAAYAAELGEDDPDTLRVRAAFAQAYWRVGDRERAMPAFERTLKRCRHVLGPDHPDTLAIQKLVAAARAEQGDAAQAMLLQQALVEGCTRTFGPDHPRTFDAQDDLARMYGLTDATADRVVPMYERTLAGRMAKLGYDHPDTLRSRARLARAYRDEGDLDRAEPLLREALADSERVLGPGHPETCALMDDLAGVRLRAGDPERAVPLYEQALEARAALSGDDALDTHRARRNLAIALTVAGTLSPAFGLLTVALAGLTKALGRDHPETRSVQKELARRRHYEGEGAGGP